MFFALFVLLNISISHTFPHSLPYFLLIMVLSFSNLKFAVTIILKDFGQIYYI